MRPSTPRNAHYSLLDVSAWAVVTVTTIAAIGLAIIAVTAIVPSELPLVGGAAALLVVADGFAALRHMRAVRRANEIATEMTIARGDEVAARDRLSFARHAAALMTSRTQDDGIHAVLAESLTRFAAHAAALVGADAMLVTSESADPDEAEEAVRDLALQTLKEGRSVTIARPGTDGEPGFSALTAPVRVGGELNHALVLWRRGHAFRVDDLDGLSLVARILELSMENHALVGEVRDQLSGTLRMMVDLVEQRLPDYREHSHRVALLAAAVGRQLGLTDAECEELRTAALLHDVGMLAVPETILNLPRRLTPDEMALMRVHPVRGAELTRAAGFPVGVQEAIRSHHERFAGDGYPGGLRGDAIPLGGRIVTVCDAFVALISDRPHRQRVSAPEAMRTLQASAGTHYDARVVEAFVRSQTPVVVA